MLYRVGLIFKFLNKLLVFILWPKIQDFNKFGPVVLAPHNTKGISTKPSQFVNDRNTSTFSIHARFLNYCLSFNLYQLL